MVVVFGMERGTRDGMRAGRKGCTRLAETSVEDARRGYLE